jgi:hypothetical protein
MKTIDSLRRAVAFGIENGKKNLVVDIDVLESLFSDPADLSKLNWHDLRRLAVRLTKERGEGGTSSSKLHCNGLSDL